MKKNNFKTKWEKEFNLIKDKEEFKEFYCYAEDNWLQYSNWNEKIKGIFGSYKKAVLSFYKTQDDIKI